MVIEKKNCLFILPSLKRSGPVIGVLNILKYLDNERIQSHVIAIKQTAESDDSINFEGEVDYCNCFNNTRFQMFTKLPTIIFRINKYIKKHDIDVIYSTGLFPDLINSLLLTSAKKVSTVRTVIDEEIEK